MRNALLISLGAGVGCAALYLSVLFGGPGAILLSYFSQMPLYLVGLSLGTVPAVTAAVSAALIVAFAGSFLGAGLFALLSGVPAILIVHQTLRSRPTSDGGTRWYPTGRLAALLAGLATAVFILAALIFADGEGFEANIQGFVGQFLNEFRGIGTDAPQTSTVTRLIAAYFPGGAMVSWLLMVTVNATLAQALLAQFKRNLRPTPSYGAFRVPDWVIYVLIAAGLLTIFGRGGALGYVAANLIPLWGALYLLGGLAVLHAISRAWPGRPLIIAFVYMLLILFGWPAVLIAGLGIVDQWAHLRRRYAPGGQGEEDA
ncbi:MAG: DUF2232 domain-containing protein [Alphaproteobacteria bacterium]